MSFTTADKLKSLRREIALRKSAYPKWIGSGKMTQEVADWEIEIMQAIHDDIEQMEQKLQSARLEGYCVRALEPKL
jgi:hypothetical protein